MLFYYVSAMTLGVGCLDMIPLNNLNKNYV